MSSLAGRCAGVHAQEGLRRQSPSLEVMAILVTGATGNAGGAVVEALLDLCASVRAVVRQGSDRALPEEAEAVEADLNDPESIAEAFR